MRIFNWMFNKANGRKETSRRDNTTSSLACHASIRNARKEEEFSDWPESLLSIGTFGTSELNEVKQKTLSSSNNKNSEQDLSNFTAEEVKTLVKELEGMGLDRLMDCSTSLTGPNFADYEKVLNDSKIVLSKGGRGLLDDTKNSALKKKREISFLLKKLFACQGGFAPAPALRDPFSQSRMEKLLKSMLGKKIYPQNATATSSKKNLERRKHQEKLCLEEAVQQEQGHYGAKWVKTDSEYIVLEI